jgi:hypothetical protein
MSVMSTSDVSSASDESSMSVRFATVSTGLGVK